MLIKVKKLHPDAILPKRASDGAACFDLCALASNDAVLDTTDPHEVAGGLSLIVRTGLSFEIPDGYAMMIYSRSGHGFKSSIRLANCVGVIDSDYRGEVMVKLTSDAVYDAQPFPVKHGDRIAQAMIIPVPTMNFVESTELSGTERGQGGFGSTGA